MQTEASKRFKFKPVHAVAIVVVITVVLGALYLTIGTAAQATVVSGDNVSVYYTGSYTNGTVFGTNVGQQPINFTVGSNQMIRGFDQAVVGMKVNQTKTVTLTPSEAYGYVNQSLIITVPRARFGNQSVMIGEGVGTASGAQGIVTAVNATNVTVNFNSRLAGQTLVFKITVASIRK